MEVKIKAPAIHNRFDVFRKNAITGIDEQIAYAENIILDTMWTQLCAGSYPFVNIQYGTGTGTLEKTRTTLFTYLGSKAATLVTRVYANPTSYLRQSIEIGLTEHNGSVLTEVGLSNTTGNSGLRTHAMLRDMNGNPVSITKTSVDILTIYGTLYASIDDTHATLNMLNAEDNGLIRQIMRQSGTGTQVSAGQSAIAKQYPKSLLSASLGSTSTVGTWTADVANKRRTLATPRFNVNDANGNIKELLLGVIARLILPASGIYAGLDLTNVTVGSGDGIKTYFVLPSRNIRQDTIVIKKDGTIEAGITKELVTTSLYHMSSNYIPSSYNTGKARISSDGSILVLSDATGGAYPYISVFDLVDGLYVLRQEPSPSWSVGNGQCAISADGSILAMVMNASPYVKTYEYVVNAWIARPDPVDLPTAACGYVSMSDDGTVLAVTHPGGAPYITIYDWSGVAWIKRANTGLTGSNANTRVHLSGNGLVLQFNTSNQSVSFFSWNGSSWVSRGTKTSTASSANGLSYDGSRAAISSGYSAIIAGILEWNGSSYEKMAGTISAGCDCAISRDGLLCIIVDGTNPYSYRFYRYELGAWVEFSELYGASSSYPIALAISNSGTFYSAPSVSYPTAGILAFGIPANTKVTFTTPPGLITGEAVGTGDGSDVLWPLLHTPIGGSLVVKLDGVTTTDYTLSGTDITFNTAPGVGVLITADYRYTCAITADYTVDGIHKTTTRVIDLTFTIQFGEPT